MGEVVFFPARHRPGAEFAAVLATLSGHLEAILASLRHSHAALADAAILADVQCELERVIGRGLDVAARIDRVHGRLACSPHWRPTAALVELVELLDGLDRDADAVLYGMSGRVASWPHPG